MKFKKLLTDYIRLEGILAKEIMNPTFYLVSFNRSYPFVSHEKCCWERKY